jgi:hypothetical protein
MTATWPADWDAMVAGQDCSMCAKGRPDDDGFGIRIQAARYSDAYLQRADMQRGYRALAAARQRSGEPATPGLDPVFVALNPGALPARERSPAELHQWVRREEQYATLGANVVVELYSESHARKPTTRAWAIIRRADRAHRLADQRASRLDRRHADRADRSHQPQERETVADAR